MFKYFGIILILSSTLFFSCEDPLQKEREQLYQEVMLIHDEMMPQMSSIRGAQKKLESMIKDAEQVNDSTKITEYKMAHQQLEKADGAMFEWMKQFTTPTVETSNEEAIKYLRDQKEKVAKMKEIMVQNMGSAKKVIEF